MNVKSHRPKKMINRACREVLCFHKLALTEARIETHKKYLIEHTKADFIPFEELHKIVKQNIEEEKAMAVLVPKINELEAQLKKEAGLHG